MEWIWLLFILFSVLYRLVEKAGKIKEKHSEGKHSEEKHPEPASPHSLEGAPFFPEEWGNWGKTDTRPVDSGHPPAGRPAAREERFGEDDFAFPTRQGEKRARAPGGLDGAGGLTSEFRAGHSGETADREILREETREWPAQLWKNPEKLLAVLALSQVIKRPDFRTIPWQRRL